MKFEDLVKAINDAPNEFALGRLPFQDIKDGLADLQKRIHELESRLATPPPFQGLGD